MKKTIKRNELAIFEEFRLKPPKETFQSTDYPSRTTPREEDLKKLNLLCKVGKDNNPISWWKKRPNRHDRAHYGKLMQVNEFGEVVLSGDEHFEKNIPEITSLKKFKTKVKIFRDKNMPNELFSWWVKDENNNLIQVNAKDDEGIKFSIKSWLRNKAIDNVGLEIRSMKRKAYEYSKEKLEEMIKEEEKKIIKKKGWLGIRAAAVLMGFGYIPFI